MAERCLNIIVYYDNYDEVSNYVKDAISIGQEALDVAIVVNKNDKKQLDILKEQLGEYTITFYDFSGNIGYLNSLCYVLDEINVEDYKYIILSNTDIIYRDRRFFDSLMNNNYDNEIGCIAPSVYSVATDSYANPHYRERVSKEKFLRLKLIFGSYQLAKLYLKLSGLKTGREKCEQETSCQVYSPHGCYMIFTQDFAKKIKGYHYAALMYSEESCVGELLMRYNKKCLYDSSIEVVHNESSVTGSMPSKERFKLWRESIAVILREFY